jgi:hypothetical protein
MSPVHYRVACSLRTCRIAQHCSRRIPNLIVYVEVCGFSKAAGAMLCCHVSNCQVVLHLAQRAEHVRCQPCARRHQQQSQMSVWRQVGGVCQEARCCGARCTLAPACWWEMGVLALVTCPRSCSSGQAM